MFGKNLGLLLFGFLGLWLILAIERVLGLPGLFIFGWLFLAGQLRLRTKLIGSLVNSLLMSALYGVSWQWSFLILWLGVWWMISKKMTPLNRWWNMTGWSLGGAWLMGGLSELALGGSFSWLAWIWPVFWLGCLLLLKLRHWL